MKNRIGSALCFKRSDSTGIAKFVWDQENVIAETDDADATQVVYTLEPLTYGNLISQKRGANTSYHLFDALGSTDRLTDGSATVTDNYVYEGFGTVKASSGSTTNPYQYVGQVGYYDDPDLVEQYVRARWYDPVTARWLAQDFEGFEAEDPNLYRYAANQTIFCADPSGTRGLVFAFEGTGQFARKNVNLKTQFLNPLKNFGNTVELFYGPQAIGGPILRDFAVDVIERNATKVAAILPLLVGGCVAAYDRVALIGWSWGGWAVIKVGEELATRVTADLFFTLDPVSKPRPGQQPIINAQNFSVARWFNYYQKEDERRVLKERLRGFGITNATNRLGQRVDKDTFDKYGLKLTTAHTEILRIPRIQQTWMKEIEKLVADPSRPSFFVPGTKPIPES